MDFAALRKLTGHEVKESKTQVAWLLKKKFTEASKSHKVRIHHADGRAETRFVSDQELDIIRGDQHVTKVEHLLEQEALNELCETEKQYENSKGETAYVVTHKYSDASLSDDHYVHIQGKSATVHDSFKKAHAHLSGLGFKPLGK